MLHQVGEPVSVDGIEMDGLLVFVVIVLRGSKKCRLLSCNYEEYLLHPSP